MATGTSNPVTATAAVGTVTGTSNPVTATTSVRMVNGTSNSISVSAAVTGAVSYGLYHITAGWQLKPGSLFHRTTAGNKQVHLTPGNVPIDTVVSPAPTAAFSNSNTNGVTPLTVQFTDTSAGNPTAWLWDFGDGTGSSVRSPGKTYSVAGTYTVTLTATNAGGSTTVTKTNLVTVAASVAAPVAAFTGSPTSGTTPLAVQFTSTSTGSPTSYAWTFGDGTTSTAQNPLKTYSTNGTYTVALTVTNAGGSNTQTRADYIGVNAAPTVDSDFSDSFTGTNGAALGAGWTTTAGSGTVTIQNNALRLQTAATAFATGPRTYNSGASRIQDSDLLFDYTVPTTKTEMFLYMALRSDGAVWPGGADVGRPSAGYYLGIRPNTNNFRIVQGYNAVNVSGDQPFTWAAGVTYRIRYRLDGANVYVRIWTAPNAEPATWTYTGTGIAPVLDAGRPLIAVNNGAAATVGTATIDNYSVTNLNAVWVNDMVAPTAMPAGNFTDPDTGTVWPALWAEDFDTAVLGGSTNWNTPDGVLPVANPYRGKIQVYQRTIQTTGQLGYYDAPVTTRVEDSRFIIRNLSDIRPESGMVTPFGGTLVPRVSSYNSLFIRAQWRMRVANTINGGAKFGLVWQSIHPETWGQGSGEHDFPEGALDEFIHGNLHPTQNGTSSAPFTQYRPVTDKLFNVDRTFTSQWEPQPGGGARLRWWVDNEKIMDRTAGINATQPMVFMLQTGPNGVVPDPATVGEVQIDWCKIWVHPSGSPQPGGAVNSAYPATSRYPATSEYPGTA